MTGTSLRERLEAKRRRTVTLPVQVSVPPPADLEALKQARIALFLAEQGKSTDAVETAQARVAAAEAALEGVWVHVEFVAMLPDDMEALMAAHRKPGDEAEVDVASMTPTLAAECAVDPGLRDVGWWTEQLASAWSYGERTQFSSDLFELNYSAPAKTVPKG